MSQSLLAILVVSLPLAALAWCLGWLAEQTRIGPRARSAIWQLAVLAPLFLAPAVWAAASLDLTRPMPAPSAVSTPVVTSVTATAALPETPLTSASLMPPTAAKSPPSLPMLPYAGLVLALIACGSAVKLTGSLGRNLRLGRLLAHSHPCDSAELKSLLEDVARRAGIRQPGLRLWAGGEPVLVGAMRPIILLPERLARDLPVERIDHVFSHELAHLKARDHWRLPLLDVLTSLFWFNPPLAACAARLMNAQEEACDARALAGADRRTRRAYAETLFNLLKAGAVAEPAVAFTGWRRSLAVKRLRAVLNPPPPNPVRSRLSVILAGLTLTGGLAGAAYALAATLPAPTVAPARPASTATAAAAAADLAASRAAAAAPQAAISPAERARLDLLAQSDASARNEADRANIRVVETSIQAAQTRYDSVKGSYDLGRATKTEMDTASAELARAQADAANLRAQQAEAARNRALAGLSPQPVAARPALPANPTTMIDTLTTALAQARVERIRQETVLDQVSRTSAEALPGLVDDPELKRLAAAVESAGRPSCPAEMACQPNQAQIDRSLSQMASRARALNAELAAKLKLARAQESALQAEIDRVRRGST